MMLAPLDVLRLYPPHEPTLPGLLASRVAAVPRRDAVVFGQQHWTFEAIGAAVARTARALARHGVRAGDRVGVVSANHPSTVVLFHALAHLGAIMVPTNPEFGVSEMGYVLSRAEVCGVVASFELIMAARSACEAMPSLPWFLLNERGSAQDAGQGTQALDELAAREPAEMPPCQARPRDACIFIYTSGTTGFPKAVMHSQETVVRAAEGYVSRMHLQPDDRVMCILPMFHVNALFYSVMGSLAAGAALVLETKFSASGFWSRIHASGATCVNTIAAVNSILIKRPRSEYVPGHSLRKMFGAPYDEATCRTFQQEFHVPVLIEGFGMSEVPSGMSNPFLGPHKLGSMGLPTPHPDPSIGAAEFKLVDEEGAQVPQGEPGELLVRTPLVMMGYYKDEEATRLAFRDGWFSSGDLARQDADGYYWFVGRKKDIIRRRGENISGGELDRVIGMHPDILEAAAIAVPSELGEDEILVAAVVRPGSSLQAGDIGRWCGERLAASKAPRYVVFLDALPHTPTHRVAKFKLRQDASLMARATDLLGAC